MASRRQDLSSEVSSEENSPDPLPADDESASGSSSKRSYECVFCKRGFTNAQALGGHMNIHRKDRARAKQVVAGPSHSNPSSLLGTKPPKHYPVWESQMGYYAGASHVSMWDANGRYSSDSASGNFFDYHSAPRPGYPGTNYEVTCAILSSRMELSRAENYEEQSTKEEEEEDEIDLELRLGRCGR